MKTMIVVILICMLLLFLLKVPVYISMALTGCALMVATSGMKWSILTQYLYTGTNSFTLLAIPLFLLAAKLMNTGGITKKLFAFCMKVVGWLPGGLGHVNILSSVIFAGMSGTAVSDAGGLGAIEIKAMNEHGFDNDFSCCVTAASSTMGPIIPPSIPLVVYATVSGASVGALFMAGIVPGLLLALQETYNLSDEQIKQGLYNASAIGYLAMRNATVAGAVGGCQAEVGIASAMAASATVELMGGSPEQSLAAASTVLMNMLGLVCDPVGGLVEYPCQNRNAAGVANATIAAEIALSGVRQLIPFDEMLEAVYTVGKRLPAELRETALGGCATTPSACAACHMCD